MTFSLILYITLSLFAGFIAGMIICLKNYPTWAFDKIYKQFKEEGFDLGQWKHYKDYADHTLRLVPKPNCETLYSGAFISRNDGPCVLSMPAFENYFSFVFISRKTNVLGYFTNRDAKEGEDSRVLVYFEDKDKNCPEFKDMENAIKLDTDMCWIIGRFGIDGPDQLAHVNSIQETIKFTYPK